MTVSSPCIGSHVLKWIGCIVLAVCCAGTVDPDTGTFAPLPVEAPSPDDNPTTPEKVLLGKELFFDQRLSGDNDMSCATCHAPEKGFGDGLPRALGHRQIELSRNTPTILNAAFYTSFFWDGRSASLEEQALVPIQAPHEMNQALDELVNELANDPDYAKQFQAAFGRAVNADDIAKAIAAYERTLITRDSPFDRYLAGDSNALSERAIEGMTYFMSTADCIRCHNGPMFSDGKYYRIGIDSSDKGRGEVTGNKDDWYRFRTPSLRDIARTAPYMHDGSEKTLFDAVEYYYRRVPTQGKDGLPLDVEPLLSSSYSEIEAIVEFLKSLSGTLPAW